MSRFSFVILLAASTLLGAAAPLPGPINEQVKAVVGRPLTPVSYAGVARRTTRRAVYATSAAAATAHPPPAYW
jgi:hypothetical protein